MELKNDKVLLGEVVGEVANLIKQGKNWIEIEFDEEEYIDGFNIKVQENTNNDGKVLIDLDMEIFDLVDTVKDRLTKLLGNTYELDFGYIGGRF